MEYFLGFLIATAVGLTGVGAGSITAPLLILCLNLKPEDSVGTALLFAAVIKSSLLPIYIRHRQVHGRILILLCAGGIPGLLGGVVSLGRLNTRGRQNWIYLALGLMILAVSLGNLYRSLRGRLRVTGVDHSQWLPAIALLIGTEVGFSSAGAGALGTLALLNLTRLSPAQVVGTDMVFGFVLSVIGGSFNVFAGHYVGSILGKLIVGGVVGAVGGAFLSSIVPARPLRLALTVLLSVLGAQLCWKSLYGSETNAPRCISSAACTLLSDHAGDHADLSRPQGTAIYVAPEGRHGVDLASSIAAKMYRTPPISDQCRIP